MIVGSWFPGDDNEVLKEVQHELYGQNVSLLFFKARERYLRAVRLVGTEAELARRLESINGFDHRTLQMTHDIIAAQYRLEHGNHGQMPLPWPEYSPYRGWLAHQWLGYYAHEVDRLIDSDAFTRQVLCAAVHANAPAGYAAGEELVMLLRDRYPHLVERSTSALFKSMRARGR